MKDKHAASLQSGSYEPDCGLVFCFGSGISFPEPYECWWELSLPIHPDRNGWKPTDDGLPVWKLCAPGANPEGNGTEYSRITSVPDGTECEWIATAQNGWHAVKIGSQVGWVSGKYSKITTD